MTKRPRIHRLFPLLALSMIVAMSASARAQDRDYQRSSGTSATLQINFGTTPRWGMVQGTRVEVIRDAQRPDFDMFRYNGSYYVYDHDRWYTSRRGSGEFTLIEDRAVPVELSRVPREHWRSYPSRWNRDGRELDDDYATLDVRFRSAPRWMMVQGTRVEVIHDAQRPDFDMFRYNGGYYAYNHDRWYMSNRGSGEFTLIDDRSVPAELSRVPREHWRAYPSRWDRDGRGSEHDYATLDVRFRSAPRWMAVRGTQVRVLRVADQSGYDMFRYRGNYYVYDNGRWYVSRHWRGEFRLIDNRSVPYELARVPRQHWRNYPADWSDRYGDNRNQGRGRGRRN